MQYTVIIEQGPSSFGASVPDLPSCIAVAETEAEVLDLIREAIQFHLEDMTASGQRVPKPASKSVVVDIPLAA